MHTLTPPSITAIAFVGVRKVASGPLDAVALAVKAHLDRGSQDAALVFNAVSSEVIDLDLRGTPEQVLQRLAVQPSAIQATADAPPPEDAEDADASAPRGRGRPKLGVVSREVTLLPRHWQWLGTRPGGASVTLRRMIDTARRASADQDALRQAQESAYRFMAALGGNLSGFEEASRALFANDDARYAAQIASWPTDLQAHAQTLADRAFAAARQVARAAAAGA